MVRISKQSERRARSPRRPRPPSKKTGPRSMKHMPKGYLPHVNAIDGDQAQLAFIPKIR